MPTIRSVEASLPYRHTAIVRWAVSSTLTERTKPIRYIIKTLHENKTPTTIPDIAIDAPSTQTLVQGVGDRSYVFSVQLVDSMGLTDAPVYSTVLAPIPIPTNVVATFDTTGIYAAGKARATVSWGEVGNYTVINNAIPNKSILVINDNKCVIENLQGGLRYSFNVVSFSLSISPT
jgi:hypothetical protein